MEDELRDDKFFARFEKYDEFLATQRILLSLDLAAKPSQEEGSREWHILEKLKVTVGCTSCSLGADKALRRSAATRISRATISARSVSGVLGHSCHRMSEESGQNICGDEADPGRYYTP